MEGMRSESLLIYFSITKAGRKLCDDYTIFDIISNVRRRVNDISLQ